MTVTAVVCCGWPQRAHNVNTIVNDLLAGTVAPNTIIVLDNFSDGTKFDSLPDEVKVVAGHNWECRGKYVAALLQYANYYLLCDDDMTVGPRTLETLLRTAPADDSYVTANRGVTLTGSRQLSNGIVFDAHTINAPSSADVIYGSCAFMAHQAVLNMLAAEASLRHRWPTEGDDILAGLANNVTIQPMYGDAAFKWLADGGVAMAKHPDYVAMRDRFTSEALQALGK